MYLIAAAGSASMEPKFPCPWISGHLKEKLCKQKDAKKNEMLLRPKTKQ